MNTTLTIKDFLKQLKTTCPRFQSHPGRLALQRSQSSHLSPCAHYTSHLGYCKNCCESFSSLQFFPQSNPPCTHWGNNFVKHLLSSKHFFLKSLQLVPKAYGIAPQALGTLSQLKIFYHLAPICLCIITTLVCPYGSCSRHISITWIFKQTRNSFSSQFCLF